MTEIIAKNLKKGNISSAAIHGDKAQNQRQKVLQNFKSGKIRVLVATDIAARGLDIDQLPHVVNYELPNIPEDYVHRIGRTGRAGNEGEAMSLVCVDELKLLKDIEYLIKRDISKVVVDGFEPDPSIKPEPINKGRAGNTNKSSRKATSQQRRGTQPLPHATRTNRSKRNSGQSHQRGR